VVALAGGVGAARFLEGLVQEVSPAQLTVVVNTGDDRDFFGLRVCPDLDIITYTLAGRVRRDTGWGLEGDTFECLEALRGLGRDAWFQLGDRDLATHIQRSARLGEGAGLAEVTAELSASFGLDVELLPMSEDPAPTIVVRNDGTRTHIEEYLVRDGSPDDVASVDLSAAQAAEGVEAELRRRADAVAVSPIVGGRPVKGPADRLLRAQGTEVSARGVAGLYREIARGMVIDAVDAAQEADVAALGLRTRALDTLMKTPEIARQVARAALELASA
jgi:LPPG:FO 2-phospho-L-lactate transferase